MGWNWDAYNEDDDENDLLRRNLYDGEEAPSLYDPPPAARPPSSADAVQRKIELSPQEWERGTDFQAPQNERRSIPPVDFPENPNKPIIDKMMDWTSRMPKKDDYKPSFGRKLLGGLVGGLSGAGGNLAGVAAARGLVDSKYNNALEEWQREGKSLGEVAPVLGRERASDIRQYGADITQRGQDVSRLTAEERLALDAQRLDEAEGYHNKIIGVREKEDINRGTRSAADIAARDRSTNVRASGIAADNKRHKETLAANAGIEENVSQGERRIAERDTISELVAQHPEWKKYIQPGSKKAGTFPVIKGQPVQAENDASGIPMYDDYISFKNEYDRRVKEKLSLRRPGRMRLGDVEPPSDFDEEE